MGASNLKMLHKEARHTTWSPDKWIREEGTVVKIGEMSLTQITDISKTGYNSKLLKVSRKDSL